MIFFSCIHFPLPLHPLPFRLSPTVIFIGMNIKISEAFSQYKKIFIHIIKLLLISKLLPNWDAEKIMNDS